MRPLRVAFAVALAVMVVCAGGAVAAERSYGGGHSGGGHSEGGHSGGGHSGGYSHGGGHYGGYSWGYYGGPRFGVVIGGPYWDPGWYYPYYMPYSPYYYGYPYPAPIVTTPAEPQEYIERSQERYSDDAPAPSGVWYYCRESKAYYPYVRNCPGGWRTVPARPPSGKER